MRRALEASRRDLVRPLAAELLLVVAGGLAALAALRWVGPVLSALPQLAPLGEATPGPGDGAALWTLAVAGATWAAVWPRVAGDDVDPAAGPRGGTGSTDDGTSRRSSTRPVSRRPAGSTVWKSAAFGLLEPARLDVRVEGGRGPVVGRDVVPLAALLVEP